MGETNGGVPGPQTLTPEVRALIGEAQKKFRDELLTKFAAGILAGVLGIFSLAALGAWLILKPILIKQVGGTPRGAVVAFDRDDLDETHCPDGWSPFVYARARTIVGAGNPGDGPEKMGFDENGLGLNGYVLRQHGGEQKHLLTIAEMPSHNHAIGGEAPAVGVPWKSEAGKSGSYSTWDANFHPYVGAHIDLPFQGGGVAHNTMPPFVALYFCKKNE